MKKYFEIEELQNNRQLEYTDLSNLFYVYDDKTKGDNYKTYSLNRTINITGLENISSLYFNTYRIKRNDTWALISYKNYNTTRLWWLICKTNSIIDPSEDPVEGQEIKILNEDIVEDILNNLRLR